MARKPGRKPDYTKTEDITNWEETADYVIYKEGSNYIALNGSTGAEDSVSTSAHTVINYALTNGAFIFMKSGTFTIAGDIVPTSNITWLGSGRETILTASTTVIIDIDNLSNVEIGCMKLTGKITIDGDWTASAVNFYLHDLWFKDITSTATVIAMIHEKGGGLTFKDIRLENVIVDTSKGHGFQWSGGSDDSGTLTGLYITNCTFISCGDGTNTWTVGLDILEHGTLIDCFVTNCLFQSCWESGMHMETAPTSTHVVISNCVSSSNGQKGSPTFGAGYYLSGKLTITNCIAFDNDINGIAIANNNAFISNCYIDGNSNTTYGINIRPSCTDGLTIVGVEIIDITSYGIWSFSGIDNLIIKACIIKNSTSQSILLSNDDRVGYVTIIGNRITMAGSHGMDLTVQGSTITNNHVKLSWFNGIKATGNNNDVSHNRIQNNGRHGSSSDDGITIDGIYITVIGNNCWDDQVTKTQDLGIRGANTPTFCIIIGNILLNNETDGQTGLGGAGNILDHNLEP